MMGAPATSAAAPFADLPAALVEEVLEQTTAVSRELLAAFEEVRDKRDALRNDLVGSGVLDTEAAMVHAPVPTTCGADGSYGIERLLTTDLAAAAAVAVEGLTPPSEKRHWEHPRHRTFIQAEVHDPHTATVLRAVMLGAELRLMTGAPHDLVMMDGTLALPIIYFNQALNKIADTRHLKCAREFEENCVEHLEAYLQILESERSDRQFAALPKYSTRREVCGQLELPDHYDDRGLLTMLLEPGELTKPLPLDATPEAGGWHLNTGALPGSWQARAATVADAVTTAMGRVQVFYYKPQSWLPALRIEVPATVASNPHRLATVVQGIRHQTATPSMMEPYPIYLADRTVKALARAMPSFRQVTTQRISEGYAGDIGEVFFAMHGYRSESGR